MRLRPLVVSRWPDGHENETDDDWIIEGVSKDDGVRLMNLRTDHVFDLGADHIQSFTSNPADRREGCRHGFLILHSRLILSGNRVIIEPIVRNH